MNSVSPKIFKREFASLEASKTAERSSRGMDITYKGATLDLLNLS